MSDSMANVVKLLLGKSPHEMEPEELMEHVRNMRRLRGDALVSGRVAKKATKMKRPGKEAKEVSELCKQLGVSPEDLVNIAKKLASEGGI